MHSNLTHTLLAGSSRLLETLFFFFFKHINFMLWHCTPEGAVVPLMDLVLRLDYPPGNVPSPAVVFFFFFFFCDMVVAHLLSALPMNKVLVHFCIKFDSVWSNPWRTFFSRCCQVPPVALWIEMVGISMCGIMHHLMFGCVRASEWKAERSWVKKNKRGSDVEIRRPWVVLRLCCVLNAGSVETKQSMWVAA